MIKILLNFKIVVYSLFFEFKIQLFKIVLYKDHNKISYINKGFYSKKGVFELILAIFHLKKRLESILDHNTNITLYYIL